ASTPLATDRVTTEVVNPDSVTGHTYRVFFAPLPTPVTVGSTLVTTGWNIEDVTAGDTLITNHYNKSGDDDYPVVDGIRVRVIGPYEPVSGLAEADFLCHPNDWLEGYAGFGGSQFGG